MTLEELDIPVDSTQPPDDALRVIEAISLRGEERFHQPDSQRVPALVTSNGFIAYNALRRIRDLGLFRGRAFCELGSGLGIVTCLAANLGYRAEGIEINAALVEFAQTMARDLCLKAQFHCGSYRPDGVADDQIQGSQLDAALGVCLGTIDVVYAYPWPAEERFVVSLFERFASPDALLVTYHGGADLKVQRLRGPDVEAM